MAKDDFIRVIYIKEGEGRKKRTSVSIDPDLYQVFCIINGNAAKARAIIRAWAREVDNDRVAIGTNGIGASRLVHRRMMATIKDLVEKGLVVEHVTENTNPDSLTPAEAQRLVAEVLKVNQRVNLDRAARAGDIAHAKAFISKKTKVAA